MHGGAADAGLRIVPLYDGLDAVAGPFFRPDRKRIGDQEERDRFAAFMRGGMVVLRSIYLDLDVIEPARGNVVPTSFRTDGIWVWSDALMFYVREHGIAPPDEFYAHVVACGHRHPPASPEAVRQALRLLVRR